jgi:hypothetical protein
MLRQIAHLLAGSRFTLPSQTSGLKTQDELELRETGSLIFPPAGKAIFSSVVLSTIRSNMAHETSFIVEYSDSEDDLYNDMFDSDCEGMSSAEELDLELALFDDNSRQVLKGFYI